jgi:hypothetical protein
MNLASDDAAAPATHGRLPRIPFIIAALTAIITLAPVGYTVLMGWRAGRGWLTADYFQSMVGNLFATVVGVGVGLPVALWVNRIAQRENSSYERLREEREHDLREQVLLSTIAQELRENVVGLQMAEEGTVTQVHYLTARWRAIVSAGGVADISDSNLISAVATAYERLETLNILTVHWLSASTSVGVASRETGEHAVTLTKRLVVAAATESLEHINLALPLLEARARGLNTRIHLIPNDTT